jgi:hypothetical protein
MAQVVEHFPIMYETRGSIPTTKEKSLKTHNNLLKCPYLPLLTCYN